MRVKVKVVEAIVRPAGVVNGDKMGGIVPPIGRTTAKTASNLEPDMVAWTREQVRRRFPHPHNLLAISDGA